MTALATQPDLRSVIMQDRLRNLAGRRAQLQATPQQRIEALRTQIQDRIGRRSRTAALIQQSRAATPQSLTDKRKKPRLTLEDLETLSETELSQQLAAEPRDKRSGFQKFFDLIDLPRNVVANVFFRGAATKKANDPDAERGTFGLPKVFVSDVLDEMGFEPGFARSVLGFVGDVALDPLTYLGGAGGAKVALRAGETSISRGATRALNKTISRVAAGQTVQATGRLKSLQPVVEQLMRRRDAVSRSLANPNSALAKKLAKSNITPEQFLKQNLRQKVFGATKIPKAFDAAGLPFTQVGVLGQKVGRDTRVGRGVTEFLQKEAVRGGLQLSVPFTGIGGTILATGPLKQLRNLTAADMTAAKLAERANIQRAGEVITQGQRHQAEYAALAADYQASVAGAIGDRTGQFFTDVSEAELHRVATEAAGTPGTAPFRFGVGPDQITLGREIDDLTLLGRKQKDLKGRFKVILSNIDAARDEFAGINIREMAAVDGATLKFMADLHSPAGLAMSTSPTMMARASRLIRGADPDAKQRKAIADGLTFVDDKLRRLLGTGIRGTAFGQTFRHSANLIDVAKRHGELLSDDLKHQIDGFVSKLGNDSHSREKVNEYIVAKLELGMAQAVDPKGQALYAAPDIAIDLADPDSIRAAREYAFSEAGRAQDGRVVWDEIFDTILDGTDNEDLWNNSALNEFVSKFQDQYSQLNELQIKAGLLTGKLPNFAARKPLPEAQQAINRAAATRVHQTGGASEAAALGQFGFQKHRTTNRYVWTNPKTGERFSYYAFEAETPEIAARIKKAVDEGLVPEWGYQTSAKHVNVQSATGESFQTLYQGDYIGKLHDEAPEIGLANHYSQVQQAKVGKSLANYLRKDAHAVDESVIREWVKKNWIERVGEKDAFGKPGAFRIMSSADPALAGIGERGDIIRRLVNLDESNPVARHLNGLGDKFMDSRVADKIEDFAAQFNDPTKIEEALGMMDGLNSFWKVLTLAHPSWMTYNVVGNGMASIMLGAKPRHIPLLNEARKLYTGRRKILNGIPKGTHSLDDLARFMDEGVQVGEQTVPRREIFDVADSTGILEPGRTLRGVLNHGMNLSNENAQTPLNNSVTRNWFGFNHHVEQVQRLFSMLVRMDIGDEIGEASSKALLHHYDYGDFTKFENSFLRRLVLFYPWMRNNTPFMIQSMLREPKWAAAFPKLHEAVESTLDDHARIAPEHRPGFFNEQLGAQFAEGMGVLLPMLTPIQDLAEVGQAAFSGEPGDGGIKNFLHWATSSTNPFLQLPFELASGRELFTGRPIGDPDIGEVSAGAFISEQLRPIREFRRFASIFADDKHTVGERAERAMSRLLLAGRVQFLDPERAAGRKTFELAETSKALRNRLNRLTDATGQISAEDQAEATRINVRLFNTWKDIFAIDPESAFIPKRIRERFATQVPTPGGP